MLGVKLKYLEILYKLKLGELTQVILILMTGLKNNWRQIGSDDFKTLTAEHIDSDLVSSKRRVYKDVDISGGGDSTSNTQTQYETSLGRYIFLLFRIYIIFHF